MSKTPYEIRLELLQLATTVLSNRLVLDPLNTIRRMNYEPPFNEIMTEAQKLNMFVTDSCCICKDCDCNPCECVDG